MSMETILAGISLIGCVGAGVALRCARNEIAFLRDVRDSAEQLAESRARRLEALRSNCFLTNEKGHRVRYWNASLRNRWHAEIVKRGV